MLKKIPLYLSFLLLLILLSSRDSLQAQEIHSKTGFGYYDPQIFEGFTGNIFYTDIGIKLPTDFVISVGFGLSDVYTEYGNDVPLFEGFRSIRNYYHFRLLVDKELYLGKKQRHVVNFGTGITYIQLRYAEPFAFYNSTTDELTIGISESNRQQDNAGFLVHADYGYKVGKFSFGIRSEIHLLLDVGLGGLIISPNISLRF